MRIVELRIHGVSGTPPQDMLALGPDDGLLAAGVTQVAGDRQTQFFQRKDQISDNRPTDADHVLECYQWGQLTSGTWTKALWLLLVPFGVVNMAHFMLPTGDRPIQRGLRVLAQAMLRGLGLIQTLTITVAAAEALMDQTAWQFTGLPSGDSATARTPDPRFWVVGAMVATALLPLAIFFFAGRRAPGAGEPVAPAVPRTGDRAVRTGLLDPEFDVGDPDVPTLRNLHLTACWSLIGVIACWVHDRPAWQPGTIARWLSSFWVCAGLILIAAALVGVVVIGNPHIRHPRLRRRVVSAAGVLGALLGLAELIAGAVQVIRATGIDPGARPAAGAGSQRSQPVVGRGLLPGIAPAAMLTVGAAVLVIGLLLLFAAPLAAITRSPRPPRPFLRYLGGMTGPVLAWVGVLLGVGFGGAAVFAVQRLLKVRIAPGYGLQIPAVIQRISHGWGIAVAFLVLAAIAVAVVKRLQRNTFQEAVRLAHNVQPYPGEAAAGGDPGGEPAGPPAPGPGLVHPDDLTRSAIGSVASAWWVARLKLHVQYFFCGFAVLGLAISAATLVMSWFDANSRNPGVCADPPARSWQWIRWTVDCSGALGSTLIGIGSLTLLGLGAGLIYLGRRSLRDSSVRRGANVVWDVIAFWPRAAHPLVPPPYTAKAIDQLRRRVYFYLDRCACPDLHTDDTCTCAVYGGGVQRVLLAPHSQGTLLAVAALLGLRIVPAANGSQLPGQSGSGDYPTTGRRRPLRPDELGLLTFGSQLQFAYARGFPASVDLSVIRAVHRFFDGHAASPRWISLLRETDPIGGQVLSADRSLTGPATSWRIGLAQGERAPDAIQAGGVRVCGQEWRLLDPAPGDGEHAKRATMYQHSNYFFDPAWVRAVRTVSQVDAAASGQVDPAG